MNSVKIRSMILERYYTIGKRYFMKHNKTSMFPDIKIRNIREEINGNIIFGATQYSPKIDIDNNFLGEMFISSIEIYPINIIRFASSNLGCVDIPNSFLKAMIDFVILHELTHCLRFIDNCNNINMKDLNIDQARIKLSNYLKNSDEEDICNSSALKEMKTFKKSNIYHKYVVEWIIKCDILSRYGNLSKNLKNNYYGILESYVDSRSQEAMKLYKDLTEPGKQMLLNKLALEFSRKKNIQLCDEGYYINTETSMIVLKPTPH